MTATGASVAEVAALCEAGALDDDELRALMAAAVREYARRQSLQQRQHLVPYGPASGVTPTEALLAAAGLLREADVSSFELAMMFSL